jgi:hypothetical protein
MQYSQLKYTPYSAPSSPYVGYNPHSKFGKYSRLSMVMMLLGVAALIFAIVISVVSGKAYTSQELMASPFKAFYKTKNGKIFTAVVWVITVALFVVAYLYK